MNADYQTACRWRLAPGGASRRGPRAVPLCRLVQQRQGDPRRADLHQARRLRLPPHPAPA